MGGQGLSPWEGWSIHGRGSTPWEGQSTRGGQAVGGLAGSCPDLPCHFFSPRRRLRRRGGAARGAGPAAIAVGPADPARGAPRLARASATCVGATWAADLARAAQAAHACTTSPGRAGTGPDTPAIGAGRGPVAGRSRAACRRGGPPFLGRSGGGAAESEKWEASV
jgi:hypothetical protein